MTSSLVRLSPEQFQAMQAQVEAGMAQAAAMQDVPDDNVRLVRKYGDRMAKLGAALMRCPGSMRAAALAALALLGLVPAAAAQSDHPLISRYPGSTLTKQDAKDFDHTG